MADHGFKQEQKKDNKVDTTGPTPVNKNKKKKGKPTANNPGGIDPALLQAIMMMLAQSEGSAPGGPPGMGGGPMPLPPGAVPMGPPPTANPAMQGRMGMMPPMPAGMPPGGMPVR